MQYLIVLLLAVSASATYSYDNSYYPSSYGYGGYSGLGYSGLGYSGLGYSGLGYGVGGYSYAPSSYYSSGPAVSKYMTSYAAPAVTSYAAPAVTSYAAPAVTSYAAPAAVSYVKPAVTYAAAPAVSYVKPAVRYAAAPAVSYVKPAVTYAAAPAAYVAPAPRIQNGAWWENGRSHISFTMGAANKGHDGKRGTAFNLHQQQVQTSLKDKPSDFPGYPKPGSSGIHSENSKPFDVKPGVDYAEEKPHNSNEKPSDSSFFDATKSSDADRSGYEFNKPNSNDKSHFDSDSFSDDDKSSETDPSDFDFNRPDSEDGPSHDSDSFSDHDKFSDGDQSEFSRPDSKDQSFFDSDKSEETDTGRFESVKPSHSGDKSTSDFNTGKVNVENQKKVPSRFDGKPHSHGSHKSPSTSGHFQVGTPNIKFVMGRPSTDGFSNRQTFKGVQQTQHAFRDGPSSYHSLRDQVFYLSGNGEGQAYDFSSVYGPSTSLLYDGGDAPIYPDGAPADFIVYNKK